MNSQEQEKYEWFLRTANWLNLEVDRLLLLPRTPEIAQMLQELMRRAELLAGEIRRWSEAP
jgi:hypothetical protein